MTDEEFEARMKARAERKSAAAEKRKELERSNLLKLDELEQEHGDERVAAVYAPDGRMVVVGVPKAPHMQQFREELGRDGKPKQVATRQREAQDTLARRSLLFPSLTEYEALCDEFPAMSLSAANAAAGLAGMSEDEEAGK